MSGEEGGPAGGAEVTAKAVYLRCFTTKIAAEPGSGDRRRRRASYMVIADQNYAIPQLRDNVAPGSPALRRGDGNRGRNLAFGQRIAAPGGPWNYPACDRRRTRGRAALHHAARVTGVLVRLAVA